MSTDTPHPLAWLPNARTLARCGVAAGVGWLIVISGGAGPWPFLAFALVAATDFIDGYLARQWNAVSAFGAFLDPVADKLLVGFSLAALVWLETGALLYLIPAAAIILRDLIATGLRLFPEIELPVSQLAKWKTALEMAGIGAVLLAFAISQAALTGLGLAIIWLAALLSVYTLGLYIGTLIPDQNDRAKS